MKTIWILTIADENNNDVNVFPCKTKKVAMKIAALTLSHYKEQYKEFKEGCFVEFRNDSGDDVSYNLDKHSIYE